MLQRRAELDDVSVQLNRIESDSASALQVLSNEKLAKRRVDEAHASVSNSVATWRAVVAHLEQELATTKQEKAEAAAQLEEAVNQRVKMATMGVSPSPAPPSAATKTAPAPVVWDTWGRAVPPPQATQAIPEYNASGGAANGTPSKPRRALKDQPW